MIPPAAAHSQHIGASDAPATRRAVLAGAALSLFAIGGVRTARAETTFRVGDMNSVAFQDVLEASGFAKDLPYQVEYSKFPSGAPEMEALNAGAIDFGQVGDTPFLFAFAAGVPGRAIGVINYGPTQMELLVHDASAAATIADLKGRRIAVNKGGGGHLFVLSLLEKAGLGPKDVQLVFLGPIDANSAFASGVVDAWAAWPPYTTLAKSQSGGRAIADLRQTQDNCASDDYHIAHLDAIHSKREIIRDYQRRVFQSRIWSLSHVDAVAGIISRNTKLPFDLAKQIRIETEPRPRDISARDVASLQAEADLFKRHGVIGPLAVRDAFDISFTTSS